MVQRRDPMAEYEIGDAYYSPGGGLMTHEYAGHYGAKHPAGTTYDPALAAALEERAADGRITCAAAFDVAGSLRVTPLDVGKTADLLELRIIKCRLGLFGYAPEKRIVRPAEHVPDDLRERLLGAVVDGRISCKACWEIAETLGLEKTAVSGACEALGLKVGLCQLGAF